MHSLPRPSEASKWEFKLEPITRLDKNSQTAQNYDRNAIKTTTLNLRVIILGLKTDTAAYH